MVPQLVVLYAMRLKLSEAQAAQLASKAHSVVRDRLPRLLRELVPELDRRAGLTPEQLAALTLLLKERVVGWLCAAVIVLFLQDPQLGDKFLDLCARRRLRPHEDRRDVKQDAFRKAFRAVWKMASPPEKPLAWIRTIINRVCIDYIRKQRHTQQLGFRVDEATVPDQNGGRREERPDIQHLLDQVREKFGPETEAMLKRRLAGDEYEEIAGFFGVPKTTVAKRVQRAISYLRAGGE